MTETFYSELKVPTGSIQNHVGSKENHIGSLAKKKPVMRVFFMEPVPILSIKYTAEQETFTSNLFSLFS